MFTLLRFLSWIPRRHEHKSLPPHSTRLLVEILEDRTVPSVSVVHGNTLSIVDHSVALFAAGSISTDTFNQRGTSQAISIGKISLGGSDASLTDYRRNITVSALNMRNLNATLTIFGTDGLEHSHETVDAVGGILGGVGQALHADVNLTFQKIEL